MMTEHAYEHRMPDGSCYSMYVCMYYEKFLDHVTYDANMHPAPRSSKLPIA
jgi:hypothetical protein